MPAGTCCCWRRRTPSAVPCAAPRSLPPDTPPTFSAPSTRWLRRRRSSRTSTWAVTVCAGYGRRKCSRTSWRTAERRYCPPTWPPPARALISSPPVTARPDMFPQWQHIRDPLLDALFTPFPPVKAVLRLLRRTHMAGALDLARLAILPVNRLSRENFRGAGAGLLL